MSTRTDLEEWAAARVHGICLKTGPPRKVGVELEWLVRDVRDPAMPVSADRIAVAVAGFNAVPDPDAATPAASRLHLPSSVAPGVLPSGAALTSEPGGQLELSSLPADSLADCVTMTTSDMAALRTAVADAGLELAGYGLDPLRPPHRVLDLPRYAAMEAFFDRGGPWGRQMMCGTASVQVCLDAGDESTGVTGYRYRWRLVHAIGPVLVAAFANSPLREGRPTGWRSTRQQVWAHMDPGRTRPPRLDADRDPRDAWAAYALDAELMLVRDSGSPDWFAPPGVTFRTWLRSTNGSNGSPGTAALDGTAAMHGADGARGANGAHGTNGSRAIGLLRPPTDEDLSYHLSTLFPPVRPHGHLELRMIDAQPGDGWIVTAAVVTALADDAQAAGLALAAAEPIWDGSPDAQDPWLRAARCGPADPAIGQASKRCFEAADSALTRLGAPAEIRWAVTDFTERYVMKDRCPADDQLDGVSP
jgi:ergothioneine biosynthesis glutamate--cysteine ligase EgtA